MFVGIEYISNIGMYTETHTQLLSFSSSNFLLECSTWASATDKRHCAPCSLFNEDLSSVCFFVFFILICLFLLNYLMIFFMNFLTSFTLICNISAIFSIFSSWFIVDNSKKQANWPIFFLVIFEVFECVPSNFFIFSPPDQTMRRSHELS